MKKAQYVIKNSDGKYFTEISNQNKALFTKKLNQATKLSFGETQEIIPLIELYNKCIVMAEQII